MNDHCGVCGWPLAGTACEACLSPAGTALPGEDFVNLLVLAGPRAEDFPGLKNAFLAWQNKDWTRMVGQCLVAVGIEAPQVSSLPEGPAWAFAQDSAAVYLSLDKARREVVIESPLVKLPERQRVPMMRMLLELNARALGAARFCLRGDLVLLRFCDRVENLSPPKLVGAIREVALQADRFDDFFSLTFSARMMGAEAQKQHLSRQVLGSARKLAHLRGADVPPAELPALVPAGEAAAPGAAPAGRGPTAAAEAQPVAGGAVPAEPSHPAEALAARLEAADALCDLLRRGLELARPFAFIKDLHVAVPLLHARALVFRAWDEFHGSCPDAVALLQRHAAPIVEKLWESPEGILGLARAAAAGEQFPSAHALMLVVEQVVRQRAQVGAQPPVAAEPFPSAAEAKTHLRKYLSEVQRGPADPGLRHFVLIGALCELLARTRLPPPTAERVRKVIEEGRRRAPTPEIVQWLADTVKAISA